jgi:hypothetical protein
MKLAISRLLIAAVIMAGTFGIGAGVHSAEARPRFTPPPVVLVCHWVPAHGGFYIQIHTRFPGLFARLFPNDVINPADGVCPISPGAPD